MVDTFELPSACVCHYKESFGFETFGRIAQKSNHFPPSPPKFPIPFRRADCSNGAVASEPIKYNFFNVIQPSNRKKEITKFVVGSPNAKSRPRRHPHTSKRFERRRRENCTPIPCRGVKFGETCYDKRKGKSQEYPLSIVRSIMRRNSTYKSPPQFNKIFGPTCKVEEPTRVGFRFGFSFDESPMCRGESRYIFPKVAKNVEGTNRFIVNTEEYQQGVTVVECNPEANGKINNVHHH